MGKKVSSLGKTYLTLGFIFLYLPILILIIFSFNESKLVTVWGGFSTKWYGELLKDKQMLGAAWMSFKIAFLAASSAVVLGTMASIVMVRMGKFKGKAAFASMITAPLVMPEVITGLSLLLLFVAMAQTIGWPAGRGMLTILIAHVTFCTAFVAVVVSSRLREMDVSLEEAARDLGAPPWKVFFLVTLPIIAPALVSGWLDPCTRECGFARAPAPPLSETNAELKMRACAGRRKGPTWVSRSKSSSCGLASRWSTCRKGCATC